MKDSDWRIIVALYDCKNVTRAANMLYMSQPTLSKNLNRIEEELGEKIIERSNKGVVFTESGEYLAMQALKITQLISETMQHYQELRMGGQVISIGSASSFAKYALPNLMRRYNEINFQNQIRYNVQVMTSSEIVSLVQRQELKIGFVNGDRDWDSKILCDVGYGHVISKDEIRMEDLPRLPLICHHRDAYSLKILSSWWRENFKTPFHIAYTVSDMTTSLSWIKAGMGYGVMYSYTSVPEEENFYKIPMVDSEGKPIRRNTWMIYHPNNKNEPIVRKFIEFVSSMNLDTEEEQ